MNWFSIAMYAGWFAALLALISASIKPSSDYRRLARYKWRWVAINILGVIPFLGLVTAAAYVRCVLFRSDAHRPITARVRNPGEPLRHARARLGARPAAGRAAHMKSDGRILLAAQGRFAAGSATEEAGTTATVKETK